MNASVINIESHSCTHITLSFVFSYIDLLILVSYADTCYPDHLQMWPVISTCPGGVHTYLLCDHITQIGL